MTVRRGLAVASFRRYVAPPVAPRDAIAAQPTDSVREDRHQPTPAARLVFGCGIEFGPFRAPPIPRMNNQSECREPETAVRGAPLRKTEPCPQCGRRVPRARQRPSPESRKSGIRFEYALRVQRN